MILNQLRHLRLVMALLILWACSLVQRHRPTLRLCMLSVPTVSLLPLPSKCSSRTSRVVLISLLTTTSTTTNGSGREEYSPGRNLYRDFTCTQLLAVNSVQELEPSCGAQCWYHQELSHQQCMALRCGIPRARQE